ncbi:MAG: hypothetical protein QOJ73_5433 [Streptosporangiaceae bacterium]|jgi:aminoglycoside phosphotransferase (APT) family kinase protein|nr:hypothetical protein [Streptosporangiaceae bacterium]
MTSTDADFAEVVRCLHQAKDAAYRDAWKRRGEVISILANIARKADRLEYSLGGAPPTWDETWLDTAVDLPVYCLKYQTYLADLDTSMAGLLFGAGTVSQPYSGGPPGFDLLLSRADLESPEVGGRPVPEAAARAFSRFGDLEACFQALSGTQPTGARLRRVQALTDAALCLIAALKRAHPELHARFLALLPGRRG